MRRPGTRAISWFVLALIVSAGASAAPRVAVVRAPGQSDPEGLEPRLRAELEGEGFEVVLVRAESSPTRDELEATARKTDSFAAIALIRPEGSLAVDVWVTDRVTGKTVLRRIDAPPQSPEAGNIMALRAVELLRASLIELNLKMTPKGEIEPAPEVQHFAELPPPSPPPLPSAAPPERDRRPAPPEPPAPEPEQEKRFSFGLGVAALGTPDGLGPAAAPFARFVWSATRTLGLGLGLTGPALRTLDDTEGSATIDQELALAELEITPWHDAVQPFFSLGSGAYRVAAHGSAAGGYRGTGASALSFAAKVGVGGRVGLSRSIAIASELDALWLAPEPVINFAGRREASTGRPLLLGAVAIEVGW